jgi:hypothetical protein
MHYSLAAKALALTHLVFIAFVVLGGLLVLRWTWLKWVHLPAAIWGALIELFGWICPLTTWENAMLRRAGEAGYSDGFLERYIFGAIYPDGLTRTMQFAIFFFVTAINTYVYYRVFHRMPKRTARG